MRFALTLLTLAACTGVVEEPPPSGDIDPTIGPIPDIEITSSNSRSQYAPMSLTFEVENFVLDAEALAANDTTPVDGTGHVHILVDGVIVHETAELAYTLDLPTSSKPYTIAVVLAGNDHTEVGVKEKIVVNVTNPSVDIRSPGDGALLDFSSAWLTLDIIDFVMSEDVDGPAKHGQGHYHVLVDGVYFDLGTDPANAVVPELAEGLHEITVELMNNDHTSLDPVVSTTISVEVPAEAAGISIDDTVFAAEINSASIFVPVSFDNFVLRPGDVGGANVDGQGHYHVYVDGSKVGEAVDAAALLTHLSSGPHLVAVRPAENDHTELQGGDYTRFTVAESRPDIRIVTPAEPILAVPFNLAVTVTNFVLDPENIGGDTNVDGTGHYCVYIDDDLHNCSGTTTVAVSGLENGTHTAYAELVNNDESVLLQPVRSSTVSFEVAVP